MKYYDKIKTEIQKNKDYKEVKEYYKNMNDLNTYYNIGKILTKDIQSTDINSNILLKKYSTKLKEDIGKGYNYRNLYNMCEYYKLLEAEPKIKDITKLTWSHYLEILPLKNLDKQKYYIDIALKQNLSYRKLKQKIKNNNYGNKEIIEKEIPSVKKNHITKEKLKALFLEDLDAFLSFLGNNISYLQTNYQIKNNTLDFLLYSITSNNYIAVIITEEEIKKEDIIKLNTIMHDINKKAKTNNETVGIIISKYINTYKITYSSNQNIIKTKKIA